MTLVNVFLGWTRVEASVYLALAVALAWQTLRWSPNLVSWVNYLKTGVSVTVVWCSGVLMLLVFHPGVDSHDKPKMGEWSRAMTDLMLAGLAPAFGVGALISWATLRRNTAAALRGLENPKKLPLIEAFTSIDEPRDVEIASRYCRMWKEPCVLDPDAVNKAHMLIKAGLEMFPTSAYMVLLHANFMIDVLGVSQSGSRRIEEARKLNPSLMCRFIMFVRQQQATQHAAGSSVSATMDLLGYVEYQRKQRMVVRLHREALQAMCNFWKALDASSVSFTHLSKSLAKIETSVSQAGHLSLPSPLNAWALRVQHARTAQRAYRVVLESYGNNPKLVHLYGRFLQTIKNDPWHAAEYFAEAERLEEMQDGNAGGPLMPDGTPLSRMDEIDTAVLVLNAAGEVQMANRHTQFLFGYKRGMLEGKPLATLLAPHYARRLADRLASIATSHDLLAVADPEECAEMADETVVGLHSDRLAFPAKLALRKASGVGEDSTIIALIEPVPTTPGVSSLWVTHNGIITSCDPSFVSNFGWKASEVNGTSIKGLITFPVPQLDDTMDATKRRSAGQVERRTSVLSQRVSESASEIIKKLLGQAEVKKEDDEVENGREGSGILGRQEAKGVPVLVPHKYLRRPVACSITIVASAARDSPVVHEIRIKVDTEPVQLLAVNRKGVILHASAELAARLKDSSTARMGALADHGPGGQHHHHHAHESGGHLAHGEGVAGEEITTVSPLPVAELTCRKEPFTGPTLELRTASGREIYMRVGVATTEFQGELVHIVHMARSSLESALAERRLRLSINPDGLIAAVESGNSSQLFGLEPGKFVGRGLWEILEEQSDKPQAPVVTATGRGSNRGSNTTINIRDVASLMKKAVKYPGHSWRVQVVPPPSRPVGGSNRLSFTQSAKPAIMQMKVVLPVDTNETDTPSLQVDLWPVPFVVGVLEMDQYGRVRAVLEERTRPAGLLFGVPTQSLVGCQLNELVSMPPGRTKPGELLFLHGHKKSSLKSQAKEASVKVGPNHVLRGSHLDGRPLSLNLQVIGKPGSNEPCTVILRVHQAPMVPVVLVAPPPQPPGPQQPSKSLSTQPQPQPQRVLSIRAGTGFAGVAIRENDRVPTVAATAPASAKLPTSKVDDSVLAMFEDGNADDTADGEAGKTDAVMVAAVGRPTTASLEDDPKPRVSSPWRPQRGASLPGPPHSPPAIRALSTPPAAKLSSSMPPEGSFNAMAASTPREAQQDMDPGVAAGGPPETDAAGRARGARHGPQMAVGRSKLADLVKSVEGDRVAGSGLGSGRLMQATRGAGANAKAEGPIKTSFSAARLLSPVFGKGQGGFKVPGSLQQEEEEEEDDAEGGSAENAGGGGSEGAASNSDDGHNGSVHSKARSETAERVKEWVASKGAYYQNSPIDGSMPISSPMSDSRPAAEFRIGGGASLDALPPPAGGPEDDEAGSDGGQSAVSGAQSATGSEYTRGKRFRKLAKLMDSSQTQMIQKRLRIHALIVVGMLALLHIICFVLTITAIKTQQASMAQLGRSGQAQLFLHRVLIDVRSLDIISHNKALDNLFTVNDTHHFIARISSDAEELKVRFNEILSAYSNSQELMNLLYKTKRRVWDTNDADGSDLYTNLTIWDFATRFYSMAKQVEQLHSTWVAEKAFIADTYPGQFLLKSGPDLFSDSRRILDALLYNAVNNARHVDVLQIVFLLVEGAGVSFVAACYIMYLLRAVAAQRFKLYGTFLVIPVGLTRALASQNTNLLVDEDEDEDGDEEEERAQAAVIQEAENAAPKLRRRATLKVEESADPGDSSGVSPGGRSGGHAGGKARRGSDNDDPSGRKPPYSDRYDKYDKIRTLTTESGLSVDASMGCCGWMNWRSRLRNLLVRRSSILPLQMSSSIRNGNNGQHGSGAKRSLRMDSHETVSMLLPFVVWSIMVITIYAVAVIRMQGVDDVVAVHSVVNFMAARTSRTVFFCQELANTDDPNQLMSKRAALLKVVKLVKDAWYTLQLGDQAYTALEHFDYVYNVGFKDLLDGTTGIADAHYATILQLFSHILLLHIILFLLFWVIFGGFLMFMLNPLLTRIAHERRRIAELMSQLPLELDVERLVARALGTQTSGQQHGAGGGGGEGDRTTNSIAGRMGARGLCQFSAESQKLRGDMIEAANVDSAKVSVGKAYPAMVELRKEILQDTANRGSI
ncbi:hypothetical protein VOLCADRAFT_106127 [Volvox carteri f. nagariensis]|uniref:PAS domain-containing protein n=1 Tax=Volvox carteri f. nagariensis TaxID=3068 RepID=D8U5A1_VOLCA|nr:uncharacterized protein VOLCADRAFT_106127 [Volvox carteri f. nagariensis]EFJ45114.1 hypothetical protein VOLCADRAFT_106127 [Volvox carteri f. nagariensis]|eukprot:XP_002953790.1 hypothetical protein VOLCADRAFT_106127 [Volvox carteri f. nagariensis]